MSDLFNPPPGQDAVDAVNAYRATRQRMEAKAQRVTRSFATWLDIEKAPEYELRRELEREYEGLAYDLKVCGAGYPSPRKQSIEAIAVELARRGKRR